MPNLDVVELHDELAEGERLPSGEHAVPARDDEGLEPDDRAPPSPDTDKDLVWLTQWSVPASTSCTSTTPSCANGGANFMVYAESYDGGAIQCFAGQSSMMPINGALGLTITYPGHDAARPPGACAATTGTNGTITIDVPLSQVSLDQVWRRSTRGSTA